MGENGALRTGRYVALAGALLVAGAAAAWLLVEAAGNYGGSCSDGVRQAASPCSSWVAATDGGLGLRSSRS